MSSTLPEDVQAVGELNIWSYAGLCAAVAALAAGQCGETLQHAMCRLLLWVAGQETPELAFWLVCQT